MIVAHGFVCCQNDVCVGPELAVQQVLTGLGIMPCRAGFFQCAQPWAKSLDNVRKSVIGKM